MWFSIDGQVSPLPDTRHFATLPDTELQKSFFLALRVQIRPQPSEQSFAAPRPFSMENRGRIRSR